jgi:hypothetical protein
VHILERMRHCILLFAWWLLLPAAAAPTRLSNGHLQIAVAPQNGALVELRDPDTKCNQVPTGSTQCTLWELEASTNRILPTQAKAFHCERLGGPAKGLRLTWSDFGNAAAPKLRVQATVRLTPGQPMSRWELAVEGLGGLTLSKVHFPRLLDLPPHTNELLAVPMWLGQLTAEPRTFYSGKDGHGQRSDYLYPGLLSMQCLAFYQPGGPGLYLACDDTAVFSKAFACFGRGTGDLNFELVHYPVQSGAADSWRMPYRVLVGTFQGDWITAAERYRAWGTNQTWATQSRLARGAVPDWVLGTDLWVWNRGRSPQVLSPALALQQKLGLPVSVFWHWWHGCAYDDGFPEYLPPREGTEPFKSALSNAQSQGLHALVYMNQRIWGMKTKSWQDEAPERFAVRAADGKVHSEIYNTFTQAPCAPMCMGTEFWRKKYAGLAERAVTELGADGVYMDQSCTSLLCYDATHGHPVGGGTYWMAGFDSLTGDIRQHAGRPMVLAGEGCGEAWLPYLDLMLSLQVSRERYTAPDGWESIPFFQAVYHACAVTYGNYSSLTMPPYDDLWPAQFAPKEPLKLLERKFSRQFYLEQARAFAWGQQPAVANFQPSQFEQRPEEIDYVLRLAKLRAGVTKYLLRGTFLRPPELHAPEEVLDISRLSIYAGQQGGLSTFQKRCPVAVAGAWRALDGEVAIAVASISNEPVTLSVNLKEYQIPKRASLYRRDENGRQKLSEWKRGKPLELKLAPRGACVLEFSKS